MQRITIRIVAIVAVILAVLLTLTLTRRAPDLAKEQTESPPPASVPPASTTRPESKDRPARTPSTRRFDSPELIALKHRWLTLGEHEPGTAPPDNSAERDRLSEESARTLLCSEEAIELILFLQEKNIFNSVETRIEKLFKSDLAADARRTLLSLPNQPSTDGTNFRMSFSREAGEGCPPDEFPAFSAALADPACSQEAYFGQLVALAQTDPSGALKATIAQIEQDIHSLTKNNSINSLIRALPPETDFAQIDSLLPDTETKEDFTPYRHFKSSLIQQWSKSDPSAAVSHIMEHPDRYHVTSIEAPISEILRKDLAGGIEWIQELPEGTYFDHAARVAVSLLIHGQHQKEAHLLASQIGDPELRATYMKAALAPPPRYEESDQDRE